MPEVDKRASANVIITGTGEITAVAFDYAVFIATVWARNKSSRAAKEEMKKSREALQEILHRFRKQCMVEEATAFLEVNPEWDERVHPRVHIGYVAEYILRLTTRCMDRVSDIHDALTQVGENVSVASPMFGLDNKTRETIQLGALSEAWRNVKEQLRQQCQVLDENKDNYEICWWDVRDEGRGRDIVAGMAHVNATLSVGFKKVTK